MFKEFFDWVRILIAGKAIYRARQRECAKAGLTGANGCVGILSYARDGMPTGKVVMFDPIAVAGIVALIDDQCGEEDGPERVFPKISEQWKCEALPTTQYAIEEAKLDRLEGVLFYENGRAIDVPSIASSVAMGYRDDDGKVLLYVRITDLLERLRMAEDSRNVPPVQGRSVPDWWGEIRKRYPKEGFWVPRSERL